ncbi:MAG TPA: DUF2497 domain-containing protein [Sphingomicrobium sp.]|nr:DUF2497 domain-containing protein [Sphingomicrobium sp.]
MAREPSMEDILASIKRVIAEEKEVRAAAPPSDLEGEIDEEDVLELDESMEAVSIPAVDLGPPLMEEDVADESRQRLEQLATVAASAPPVAQVNPLEEMVREMLRPILKQWLDDHLPNIVDEHVKREIHRITGRPL